MSIQTVAGVLNGAAKTANTSTKLISEGKTRKVAGGFLFRPGGGQ